VPVRLRDRLTELALRPGLPRRTVRLRLTLLYGGLFLVSGAALLAITYALVAHNTSGFIFTQGNRTSASVVVEGSGASGGERESKPQIQSNGPPPGSRPRRIERLTPTQQRQQDKRLAEAESRGLEIHAALSTAPTAGDPRLVESLLANLVDNALRYNVPGGQVDVTTAVRGGRSLLSISNTGAVVPPGAVKRLFQPFQRLGSDRTRHRDEGSGLGLSIVKAIADAHDATVIARPPPEGGLHVDVSFPAPEVSGDGNAPSPHALAVPDREAAAPPRTSHQASATGP
jgi:Histidine kinase-, DNA gyrase B-, and HSP90-like ATPase